MDFSERDEACPRTGCPASCAWARRRSGHDEGETAMLLSEAGPIRLAVASVDLGRELAARGRLRFVASSTCMYPAVRPGDVLAVAPRTASEVAVGDVLIFRRGMSLFAHRAVEVEQKQGRIFVVTQPDRSSTPDSEVVWEEDILGIASSAVRHGHRVCLDVMRDGHGVVRRGLLATKLRTIECETHLRSAAITALGRLQSQPAYSDVVRRLVATRLARVEYRVRLPLAAGRSRTLFRELSVEEAMNGGLADVAAHPDGVHWTLAATLPSHDRPIGLVTYAWRPPECPFPGWSLEGDFVRARYRGMGLEQRLIAQATRVLEALHEDLGRSTLGEGTL